MKYIMVGLALLLAVISGMYLAKSIFIEFNIYAFAGSSVYLSAFFSILSLGQSKERN